jgi:hypothetical protein
VLVGLIVAEQHRINQHHGRVVDYRRVHRGPGIDHPGLDDNGDGRIHIVFGCRVVRHHRR